jgi:putative glutamine amidotransferase
MHPDPTRKVAASNTLQFIEQSTAHWLMSGGAMPVVVPSPLGSDAASPIRCVDYAQALDGLVLHGGADVWPGSYGQTALRPEWNGDALRDAYELELTHAFVEASKPVFGICRGLQLLNVALGGTLYQDLQTQLPGARVHMDRPIYERNLHEIEIVAGTRLEQLLGDLKNKKINSIHHQGIQDLAPEFVVEARCAEDGVIEAIRHSKLPYVAGVQWHPELHRPEHGVMNDTSMLIDFLAAARQVHLT